MKTIWFFFFAFALTGCGVDKNAKAGLPEVNEANCHPQNIEKMPTKRQREDFASLCFKQGDWHKKSSERKW